MEQLPINVTDITSLGLLAGFLALVFRKWEKSDELAMQRQIALDQLAADEAKRRAEEHTLRLREGAQQTALLKELCEMIEHSKLSAGASAEIAKTLGRIESKLDSLRPAGR